jgi:hypothetical protein
MKFYSFPPLMKRLVKVVLGIDVLIGLQVNLSKMSYGHVDNDWTF